MGAVFASAARAPLTSVASVVEMTGDFTLTLPVMLAVAIATATSRGLSYGTIYTTKLLRRGTDIDRAPSADPFEDLTAADAMRRLPGAAARRSPARPACQQPDRASLPGPVTRQHSPQVLFATESLTQALRQLELYGRDGLPVISDDGQHLQGWITSQNVLQAVARHIRAAQAGTAQPQPAAGPALPGPQDDLHRGADSAGRLPGPGDHHPGRLARRRPQTRRHHLAARLRPGLGPGHPHPARPRPRHHPGPRRPRQPARPHPAEPEPSPHHANPGSRPGDQPNDARPAAQAPEPEDNDQRAPPSQ